MKKIILSFILFVGCQRGTQYDVVIRNGTLYDGTGKAGVVGDVAINGDKIMAVGKWENVHGKTEIDATGLAVTPGFINMLSHSEESLIEDGTSQSDIRQGVTLEVLGEGSMGPMTEQMKKDAMEAQGDIKYKIEWTSLGEYLDYLEKRGISTNIASFVGIGTARANIIGFANRAPNAEELEKMRGIVRQAMEEGAMGVTCALIYTPDFFMKTDELIEMSKVAAQYGGMYVSHMRSEGNKFLEAVDESMRIAKEAGVPVEIYHLKAAGRSNWPKLEQVIKKIEQARAIGLNITADMYTYPAGATGLDASMPPWVQEGGFKEWKKRLQDPEIRKRVKQEMSTPTDKWENLYLAAGAKNMILIAFKQDSLKYLTGKTLPEVAAMRGKSVKETAMDLVIDDDTRVGTVYFLMSEENIKKQITQPWVSFGSDAESMAPKGNFMKSNPHPRAYGNFARLLGKYVREEKVISLEEAVRRLTTLPAQNLKIKDRGALIPGHFADVVVFDPGKIADHATFDKPHQYSTGVAHVFVNGVQVLKDGEHTGAKPGRVVRGPGWKVK
ncbi:MAG: D-aminoacylase [Bacteroidota bacterium]